MNTYMFPAEAAPQAFDPVAEERAYLQTYNKYQKQVSTTYGRANDKGESVGSLLAFPLDPPEKTKSALFTEKQQQRGGITAAQVQLQKLNNRIEEKESLIEKGRLQTEQQQVKFDQTVHSGAKGIQESTN